MCACPLCHDKINAGAMAESEQREAKAQPFNLLHGFAEGQLAINSEQLVVDLGSNWFFGSGAKLAVDDKPLLQLAEDARGRLQLSADLYDENDQLLALIERNDWVTGDPTPWDIEFRHNWLRIHAKAYRISLTIDAKVEPVILTGRLWRAGREFLIRRRLLTIDPRGLNNTFQNLGFAYASLNITSGSGKAAILADQIQGEGKFFNWPVPCPDRIAHGLKFCKEIRAKLRRNKKGKRPVP